MDLNEREYQELCREGPTSLHWHPHIRSHADVDNVSESIKIVDVFSVNYTASYNDDIIVADSTNASLTVTLPPVRGQKQYTITKAAAANTVTVAFSNSQTCFGQATLSIINLGDCVRVKSHNGAWIKL